MTLGLPVLVVALELSNTLFEWGVVMIPPRVLRQGEMRNRGVAGRFNGSEIAVYVRHGRIGFTPESFRFIGDARGKPRDLRHRDRSVRLQQVLSGPQSLNEPHDVNGTFAPNEVESSIRKVQYVH